MGSKNLGGRPVGSANTTGWKVASINLRPAIMDEVDRQAKRSKVSRSGWVQGLVAQELERLGKRQLVLRAEKRTFRGDRG